MHRLVGPNVQLGIRDDVLRLGLLLTCKRQIRQAFLRVRHGHRVQNVEQAARVHGPRVEQCLQLHFQVFHLHSEFRLDRIGRQQIQQIHLLHREHHDLLVHGCTTALVQLVRTLPVLLIDVRHRQMVYLLQVVATFVQVAVIVVVGRCRITVEQEVESSVPGNRTPVVLSQSLGQQLGLRLVFGLE